MPVYSEQPIFPTIRVTHVAKNLQSNRLVVKDYEGLPCRLNNYEKRIVPDGDKFYQFSLGRKFALRYFPPSFESTLIHRGWLQVWFDSGILPVRAPYFWFPSNIAIEELFEVREPKKEIELGALAKIVPTVRQRTRKIAV